MKILITGAAGFIGSNLSEYLLNKGFEVVALDNFNNYYNPDVKEYNIKDFKNNSNFHLYRIDLLDQEALEKMFEENKDISAVVHLAAWAGVTTSIDQPVTYARNNVEATVNLLEMCRKYGVNNFLFASTSSIYGDDPTPFEENMTTDYPLAPYPATKKACEVLLYTYSKNFGINTTIFRIFNPNGPRMRPDLALPILIKSCLYGKEFKQYWSDENAAKTGRDYCYVGHMFDAMLEAISKPNKYEIFNLGNSSPVTLAELIQTVEKVTGKKANITKMPPRQGEMFVTFANIDKAKKMLNYNPSTSIEQIVQIYFDWFSKQEDWYKKL